MSKDLPLVTIITATFNLLKNGREETFRQCLESVHNQTYSNVEHIIIDGDSKDGSLDLINEYVEKGWVQCYSEPDSGIYDAMNKGVLKASGKYIAFMNSDDFYCNLDAIKSSVEALEKSRADFSFAKANMLKEGGALNHVWVPKIHKVFSRMPFCHQTMFCKTDAIKEEGLFDLRFKSAADYDLIVRMMLKKYKFVEVDAIIASFRLGGFSVFEKMCILEVIECFKKNYKNICNLSDRECEIIYIKNSLPLKLELRMLNGHGKTLFFVFLKNIFIRLRRFVFQVRTRGKQGKIRILGFYLYKSPHLKKEMTLEQFLPEDKS